MVDGPTADESRQTGPTTPPPASRPKEIAFGVYLVLLNLALLHGLFVVWPEGDSKTVGKLLGLWSPTLGSEARYLALVVLTGALGSYVHLATSFADYAGARKLNWSWGWWFLLRPFIGMALAVIMYCVIRGGLISGFGGGDEATGGQAVRQLNPFGVAAIAGMTGMFSKQATDKLREVFETLFGVKDERPDKMSDKKPENKADKKDSESR